jgi:hypothetical protein
MATGHSDLKPLERLIEQKAHALGDIVLGEEPGGIDPGQCAPPPCCESTGRWAGITFRPDVSPLAP